MTDQQIATVAEGLTKAQREMASVLCGNAWQGRGRPSVAFLDMNARELMHIDQIKSAYGEPIAFKARPTLLGKAVRQYLIEKGDK